MWSIGAKHSQPSSIGRSAIQPVSSGFPRALLGRELIETGQFRAARAGENDSIGNQAERDKSCGLGQGQSLQRRWRSIGSRIHAPARTVAGVAGEKLTVGRETDAGTRSV